MKIDLFPDHRNVSASTRVPEQPETDAVLLELHERFT